MRGPRYARRLLAPLVAGLLLVPAARAGAASEFTFYGGGWGHGIGLSQYGAYGLALEGWSATRILRHYYTGVRITDRDPPKKRYRVGLLQYRSSVTVTAASRSFTLKLGGGRTIETVPQGATRIIRVSGGRFRIFRPNGALVGGHAWGSSEKPVVVRRASGGIVSVPEWGHRSGRGALEFRVAGSGSGHLVAVLSPEQYLYGLGEVPSSWPAAVLRAQAIAARTYAHRVVAGDRTGCACDILGDTRDQAYIGWDKESDGWGGHWRRAVNRTARRVVVYRGAPISTLYSSSSGGFTEDVENVWGGSALPYLRGVCDPGDYVSANPNRTWQLTLTGAEAASRLRSAFGWDVARVRAFRVGDRGVSGRIVRVTVKGVRSGGGDFSGATSGWNLRGALGLKDSRFWINSDRQVTGAIRNAYDDLRCRPGLPAGGDRGTDGGRWQRFKRGRIYHKGAVTAWLRGPVLGAYLGDGGPAGPLGYPVSQQRKLKDGRTRVRFEGGTVTCERGGTCTRT